MKTELKIKILTLASEAVHIKRHEQKWKKMRLNSMPHPKFFTLQEHRKNEVRPECRSALLAYGFLRGRDYKKIENKCYTKPDWARVAVLVGVFSDQKDKKALAEAIKLWSEKIPND